MKGLKIIPLFLVLISLTYAGMFFIQSNSEAVTVTLGRYQFPEAASGFVVLTSVFFGMLVCGLFCSIELFALYVQNKRLQRTIITLRNAPKPAHADSEPPTEKDGKTKVDMVPQRSSGRFV